MLESSFVSHVAVDGNNKVESFVEDSAHSNRNGNGNALGVGGNSNSNGNMQRPNDNSDDNNDDDDDDDDVDGGKRTGTVEGHSAGGLISLHWPRTPKARQPPAVCGGSPGGRGSSSCKDEVKKARFILVSFHFPEAARHTALHVCNTWSPQSFG